MYPVMVKVVLHRNLLKGRLGTLGENRCHGRLVLHPGLIEALLEPVFGIGEAQRTMADQGGHDVVRGVRVDLLKLLE